MELVHSYIQLYNVYTHRTDFFCSHYAIMEKYPMYNMKRGNSNKKAVVTKVKI